MSSAASPFAPGSGADLRSARTRLNLTQREFGLLVGPGAPISASVICQLETSVQPSPQTQQLISTACGALRAIDQFSQATLAVEGAVPPSIKQIDWSSVIGAGDCRMHYLVSAYAQIVTSRKPSSNGSARPATRGPYKKEGKSVTAKTSAKEPSKEDSGKKVEKKPSDKGDKKWKARARVAPKKKKVGGGAEAEAEEDAVSAPEGDGYASSSLSARSTVLGSARSSASSVRSLSSAISMGSTSTLCGSSRPRSPPYSTIQARSCSEADSSIFRQRFEQLLRCSDASGPSQHSPPQPPLSAGLDFLDRLADAEKRDDETLQTLRSQLEEADESLVYDCASALLDSPQLVSALTSPRSPEYKRSRHGGGAADTDETSTEFLTLEDLNYLTESFTIDASGEVARCSSELGGSDIDLADLETMPYMSPQHELDDETAEDSPDQHPAMEPLLEVISSGAIAVA